MTTQEILEAARGAKTAVALSNSGTRDSALLGMADALCAPESMDAILAANAEDMAAAKGRISDVMLDRLALTPQRIEAMARGIRDVAALPDPVGRVLSHIERPNGLVIEKTAVPMGVIAIIYESRPNVTSDAAALAIKSGNACILRCGKEAWRSANAIVQALRQGLRANGLPETAVCLIEDTTHASANALMTAVGYVDLLIPRGGAGLIRACVENAKVPCIQTGTGICHIFVDDTADQTKALDIIENAKASRPSVCNAEEVCLVHSAIAAEFLPKLAQRLGWQFVDTDRRIERAVGMTIAEFYASAGEKVFREREINVLQQVSRYHEAVISFGGNFPMNVGTYRILHRHGFIVALLSEPFRVEERVSRHIGKRPTVDYENLHDFVHTMMKQWEEVYPYCDCVIDTTRGGASQIVESIVHKINERHVQFIAREKKENDVK